jgi:hypothetical protein
MYLHVSAGIMTAIRSAGELGEVTGCAWAERYPL